MNKKEKAVFIRKKLNELFPESEIPLHHTDAFTLLVAVVLSAQCTDVRVNQVTPALFAKASDPDAMKRLPVSVLQSIIRPCGLAPAKAKSIHGLSEILAEKYQGKVPASFEALEALPGVGHKTASVVMAQAFNVPAFPVDTHIHRLAFRWGLTNGRSVKQTESDLKKLFPEKCWNTLHLQMIWFGRTYCPARGHIPSRCPICSVVGMHTKK